MILIGLLCCVTGYFVYEYEHMKSIIVADKNTINTLNNLISAQNAAIDDLKKQSDIKLQNVAKALVAANAQMSNRTVKAQIIYKMLPAIPGDDCKSALQLGNTQ